jgi:hypothetical protein
LFYLALFFGGETLVFPHCSVFHGAFYPIHEFWCYISPGGAMGGSFLADWFWEFLNRPLESVRINRSRRGWAVFDLKLETQSQGCALYSLGRQEPQVLIYEGARWKHMKAEVIFINSFLHGWMECSLELQSSTFLGDAGRLFKSNYTVSKRKGK